MWGLWASLLCVCKDCCCTMHEKSGLMLGASHLQCQEQPLSKWKSEHLLCAPCIEEGGAGYTGMGKQSVLWCWGFYMPTDFTYATALVSLCPCTWLTFRKRVGVGMHKKLSVCTLRGGSRLHSWFMQFPRGNLAALQPCSMVPMLAFVNAALQSFLFLALESSHGCWEKRLGFLFVVLIFSYEPTQLCNIAKWRHYWFLFFVSCWGEGQKELGEIKQWKLEWNGGVCKTRRLSLWKAGPGLGENSPFKC